PAGTPAIILIPVMMLAGMLAGGLWGFIPGVLRARLGVNEIIATLMLNYVALLWIQFWVFGAWSESGFQQTKAFPDAALLPRLAGLRLHGGHRRLPREVPTGPRDRRGDPVRGADPGRSRDPAVRRPGDDPGDHPVHPDRRRRPRPVSRPDRAARPCHRRRRVAAGRVAAGRVPAGAVARSGRLMDLGLILAGGIASGTVLLFAAIGEIFAERAGILNLGVEGMMLMGAVAGFSTTLTTGNPWIGLVAAMTVGGLLALLHAVVTIHLRADQVVSGLALTFLGTGLARVL